MTFIKMESYTIQQRVQIVELFYENRRSVKNVFRKLRDICIIVYLKLSIELFKNFKKLVRWKIREEKILSHRSFTKAY